METKPNRQVFIAIVAALAGLFLGILCGAVGGGTVGYLLGRGRAERQEAPAMPQQLRTPVPLRPQQTPLPDVPRRAMGALVIEVLPDTPAERAGLRAGDVILAVGGQQVGLDQSLTELIQQHRPGDRVLLTVHRAVGETLRVDVQLTESPDNSGRGYLGVRVQDLAP